MEMVVARRVLVGGRRYTRAEMTDPPAASPPPPSRPPWVWPAVGLVAGAAIIALAIFAGGPWLLLILAGTLIWAFLGIRFILSDRGKAILFSRFDERYEPPDHR
jgi:hypothetical protein